MGDGTPWWYGLIEPQTLELPNTVRLAPFRKYSYPYTGPPHPERPSFHKLPAKEFQDILSMAISPADLPPPPWINQSLRGLLFIHMDSILRCRIPDRHFDDPDTDAIAKFINFAAAYFEQSLHILAEVITLLTQLSKDNLSEQHYIYVHSKLATVYALTEITYILTLICGGAKEPKIVVSEHQKERWADHVRAVKIPDLLTKLLAYRNAQGLGIPWGIRKDLVILHQAFFDQWSFGTRNDVREIPELLSVLDYFTMRGVFPITVREQHQINLALLLIDTGAFHNRLLGLTELKSIQTKNSSVFLVQCLEDHKHHTLEQLISIKYFNPEIFKRSLFIIEAYAYSDRLAEEHLDQIIA